MRILILLFTAFCLMTTTGIAQTIQQNSGWLFLMNTTKFNNKWGSHLDIQLRSADKWDHLRNFMFRPGITYYVNKKNELTLGYLWNETFNPSGSVHPSVTEHRIWQQYIYKHKIGTINVSHRLRTEQRFIERHGQQDVFAQRFRYFFRLLMPLEKEVKDFEKGFFAALQNEFFLNIQNKQELNQHVFDQNRAYLAGGYRLNKALDIEAGYLNQASKGINRSTVNHVVQLAVYTRF